MSHRDPVPTPPILPDRLGAALGRLQAALGRLHGAVRSPSPAGAAGMEAPVPAGARSHRLAEERDAALARASALEAANQAALQRLERAETAIAAVMQGLMAPQDGGPRSAPGAD